MREFGLSQYDTGVIVGRGRSFADYFEATAKACGDGKQAANWVTQDVLREMNERSLSITEFPVDAPLLGNLLGRIAGGTLTIKGAREVFAELLSQYDAALDAHETADLSAETIDAVIQDRGLAVVKDDAALDAAIVAALAESPRAVEDFRAGKQQALGAVIGKVMKQLKGADAKAVREALIAKLNATS
jgi:aspartyl-tRNA(Asn)/glutamyl-tRNA(Gln) amidotransferase subunit B